MEVSILLTVADADLALDSEFGVALASAVLVAVLPAHGFSANPLAWKAFLRELLTTPCPADTLEEDDALRQRLLELADEVCRIPRTEGAVLAAPQPRLEVNTGRRHVVFWLPWNQGTVRVGVSGSTPDHLRVLVHRRARWDSRLSL